MFTRSTIIVLSAFLGSSFATGMDIAVTTSTTQTVATSTAPNEYGVQTPAPPPSYDSISPPAVPKPNVVVETPRTENCNDFKIVKPYTVFVKNFYSVGVCDVMGSVGVQKDCYIGPNYYIAKDLQVGGKLEWPGLRVNGQIGGQVLTGSETTVDFNGGFDEISKMSKLFASGNVNGVKIIKSSEDQLKKDILNHDGFTVFNIPGDDLYIGNWDYTSTCDNGKNFVFNFYEAKNFKFDHLKICGIILAPKASIHGNSGLLEGKLYATGFRDDSHFQINDREVTICVPSSTSTDPNYEDNDKSDDAKDEESDKSDDASGSNNGNIPAYGLQASTENKSSRLNIELLSVVASLTAFLF